MKRDGNRPPTTIASGSTSMAMDDTASAILMLQRFSQAETTAPPLEVEMRKILWRFDIEAVLLQMVDQDEEGKHLPQWPDLPSQGAVIEEHGQPADFTAEAATPLMSCPADDRGAADTGIGKHVDEVPDFLAQSVFDFPGCGCVSIIVDQDRKIRQGRERVTYVKTAPGAVGLRKTDDRDFAEPVRDGETDAGQPAFIEEPSPAKRRQGFPHQIDELIRKNEAFFVMDSSAQGACRVDHHDGQMIAIDIGTNREEPIGIELKLDCRLAPQSVAPPSLHDQSLVQQTIDDPGDRLLREARLAGKLRARNRSVPMDRAQNDLTVLRCRQFDVGAKMAQL